MGLLCSFLGVGVAFTAVRAISKKEAHSGIGEQGFPVAHFRAVRLLEVMFESVPQAILQTYFAIQSDKLSFFGTLTFGEVLFRLSIMFSLIQVAFFLTSMEVSVRERAPVRARAAGQPTRARADRPPPPRGLYMKAVALSYVPLVSPPPPHSFCVVHGVVGVRRLWPDEAVHSSYAALLVACG